MKTWKQENRALIWQSIWEGPEVRLIGLCLWTIFIVLIA